MQITVKFDDKLAPVFFASTPKDEQKSAFKAMMTEYLKSKIAQKRPAIIREGDDEVYGMWADREMNVDELVRELRKSR